MKKIYAVITAISFAIGYSFAIAEPVDSGPPAQQQKDNVPPSTTHDDYLEPQPDENSATTQNNSDQKVDKKAKKHRKDNSKPANVNKGKNQTEQPDSGGVDVQQK